MDNEPTDSHPSTRCAPLRNLTALTLTPAIIILSVAPVPLPHAQNTNTISALRSPFSSKSPIHTEFSPGTLRNVHPNDMELGVHVHVERTVVVEYANDSERSNSCEKPAVE
jgi:hypothetical protein